MTGIRQNTGVSGLLLTCLASAIVAGWPLPDAPGRPGSAGQDTRSAHRAYEQAVALEAQGNHAAALSLLWSAAGAAPGDADIQERLGEALERIGALDAAVDAYQRALASRPDFDRAMNQLVVALTLAGRGAEAVRRAEAWVAAKPSDPERLYTLGLAQSEQDVDAALLTLRRVVGQRPDHALAHYNLGLLLKRVDRIDDAIVAARRAASLGGRPEAHVALASLFQQQGDFAAAIDQLETAVAADRRAFDAWMMLASVRKARGDLPRAAEALRRAIALRPGAWGPHAALATVLRLAGDDGGARRASDDGERLRTREQRERAAVVMTAVGVARFDGDHIEAARERFAAAIGTDDTYAPAHYHLGRALQRLGRLDAARQAFARAHQLNPSLVSPLEAR
jgi:tetratricopeptide (TPR) repeat protein